MGRREAGDRDPERGTRYVVQAEVVTQFDARGIAPVLTADPDLEGRTDLPALLHAHPHELPDALAVQRLERVKRQDASFHEIDEDLAFGVVQAIYDCVLCDFV